MTQAEPARIAQVEQPCIAQLLGRMERDGLVERVPDPPDGRSRLISLTERASQQLPQSRAVMDDACEQALSGFSEPEREQLLGFLQRIFANLDGVPGN